MAASEQDSQANASQASMGSNPAEEGQAAAYPTPTQNDSSGPAVDNPAVPAKSQEQAESQAKRTSLKDKAKAGLASFQNKLKGIGGGANNSNNESKEEKENVKEKDHRRLSMEGLLKQARISFEKWVDVQRPHEYPMPHGIVFLTSIKGAFGWGAEAGTGIVLYRVPYDVDNGKDDNKDNKDNKDKMNENEGNEGTNDNNENKEEKNDNNENKGIRWSGPCAIGSGGISFGLQIGVSKVDHIIILPARHHVRTFTSKGQLKLGGSSELTVVNVGGKAQGSVNIGAKEMSDIHSYSLDTKGLAIGASVEGAIISVRGDCNSTFYGKNVSVDDIASGRAIIPEKTRNEDYDRIIELLNKHFKIYRPAPLHPHGPGPHHGVPPPVVGAALGVVGALVGGPHGPHGGPRGGFHGHGGPGRHGPH